MEEFVGFLRSGDSALFRCGLYARDEVFSGILVQKNRLPAGGGALTREEILYLQHVDYVL